LPRLAASAGYYGPADFTIGATLVIRARAFTVADADAATRARLRGPPYNLALGAPLPVPREGWADPAAGAVPPHQVL
jgi:hypothetical protein